MFGLLPKGGESNSESLPGIVLELTISKDYGFAKAYFHELRHKGSGIFVMVENLCPLELSAITHDIFMDLKVIPKLVANLYFGGSILLNIKI